jgi:pyruvate-ferredoxin/flavodoxin oxidoreductase
VDVCPAKNKSATGRKAINMEPQPPLRKQERENWEYFLNIPDMDRRHIKVSSIRQQQVQRPLFEFSGACSGCGETPYVKLVSQLYGDRAIIANATGCSSIYGGNLPTTPWAKDHHGRGPSWANSLFEDNAEFGLGMRVSLDKQFEQALELLQKMRKNIGAELVDSISNNPQHDEADIQIQREDVDRLKNKLRTMKSDDAAQLLTLADVLVKRSLWIIGGDGWAYDIGYGGLDHVLASGRNVNLLVLDTEVYSNTGGQASKATPLGAVAKFAAGGKPTAKKDLGLMAMSYGDVYVAQIAMGASDAQTVRTFLEAESYDGPSLIIAYSHCIAHAIDMRKGLEQQKLATESGYWPLYRYDPRLREEGKNPLQLDSKAPKIPLKEYAYNEGRFRILTQSDPENAARLMEEAQAAVLARWAKYEKMARE